MSGRVPVTKMHGTLNDFVILDNRRAGIADLASFGRYVCDRHSAIGADGLLAIDASSVADAKMRVINADGGEAEMCGNGIRCVARWLSENGEGERLKIETIAGTIETQVLQHEPTFEIRQWLGKPEATRRPIGPYDTWFVSLGNPHVVIFVEDLEMIDLDPFAEALQRSPDYPNGTNVHLVRYDDDGITVKHWERGVGQTMACGTGVVASAVASILAGRMTSPVTVRVPGGDLRVEWTLEGGAFLTGPAVRVFDADVAYASNRVRT